MVEKILRDLLGLLCCRSSLFRKGLLAAALRNQVEPFCALATFDLVIVFGAFEGLL